MNWIYSILIRLLYRNKLIIGKNVKFFDVPDFDIGSNAKIIIGDNSVIKKNCDIRAYNDSVVNIGECCKIDDGVRIIAANGKLVKLDKNVKIGYYSVLNGGGGIRVGENSSTYGFVYIQSSSHSIGDDDAFQKDQYKHEGVVIGKNCLISPHSNIQPGTVIKDKTVTSN